jgi:hypothetical protein
VSDALRRVFTARCVEATGQDRVRIDTVAFVRASRRAERELVSALYEALGRAPRDRVAETRALRSRLEIGLTDLAAVARRPGSRAFLAAEVQSLGDPGSAFAARAARDGIERLLRLAGDVVTCIDALADVRDPVRIQNFAARVLGSSKALRAGSDLWRALSTALVDHDPATRAALDEQGVPPHRRTEIARALDVNGVYQDEVAASVLCFGPLVYSKRGQVFDQVLRHSALGESTRLIVHQLRDALLDPSRARRATVFENLTPYLDYVDDCVRRGVGDEIVLCSGGQASWAVIAVLRGFARAKVSVRHSGDLDRSGVLILRSLERRSGVRIEPLLMDASTHRRFAARGKPLSTDERRHLERLVSSDPPDALCADLLRAILDTDTWIEQEQFSDELLASAVE